MAGILRLIESERRGNSVDRALCSELLRMLSSLGLYESAFQPDFLAESRVFYEAEGLDKLLSSDIPTYLLHCEVNLRSWPLSCPRRGRGSLCFRLRYGLTNV